MGNTLVVYSVLEHPLRESVSDHLEAFRRYSSRPCIYLNLAVRRVPRALAREQIDMVVFHTTFLSKRGSPDYWRVMLERARPLKEIAAGTRVALPQDEYLPPAALCDFIREFGVDHVFSVAPESQWPAIYPSLDRERVRLHRVLTGYLEPRALRRIERLSRSARGRAVDIGYRAKDLPPWLGRQAQLKVEIARAFADAAPRHGLSTDISTRPEDTLLGEEWLAFLLRCKYTIGVEGGASVLDRDGSLRAKVAAYLAEHPGASFEEVERACFPGRDGEFGLVALSPRHLEACATRTCQALVEGEYDVVLEANRHYLPLRADFSNLDEVLDEMRSDERREEIVDAAYRDVVASGRYTYARLVELVEREALGGPGDPGRARLHWKLRELLSRAEVIARARLGGAVLRAFGRLRRR
jgi:hypothetical protein